MTGLDGDYVEEITADGFDDNLYWSPRAPWYRTTPAILAGGAIAAGVVLIAVSAVLLYTHRSHDLPVSTPVPFTTNPAPTPPTPVPPHTSGTSSTDTPSPTTSSTTSSTEPSTSPSPEPPSPVPPPPTSEADSSPAAPAPAPEQSVPTEQRRGAIGGRTGD